MSSSEDEIGKYRELFAAFDLDRNVKIDVNELQIGLRDHDMDRHQVSVIKMIDDVKIDSNQELDFDKFLNLIQSKQFARLFVVEERQELKRQ